MFGFAGKEGGAGKEHRRTAATPEPVRRQGAAATGSGLSVRGLFAHAGPAIRLTPSPVQRRLYTDSASPLQKREDESPAAIRQAAHAGLQAPSGLLPHAEQIQRSFGRHDVSRVEAHQGAAAAASARAMNAVAYATGEHVVFADTPDLHTAAHESAHVVQQRGGVQLPGGVGQGGDPYERHADAVADRVAAGASAEDLLNRVHGGGMSLPDTPVQRYSNIGGGGKTNEYTMENFNLNGQMRERPKVATAYVYATGMAKPTPPHAQSFLAPSGQEMEQQDATDFGGYHRGHIIAHTLGGANASFNIVPMKPSFNTGLWRGYENQVDNETRTIGRGGGNYRMTVTMSYGGPDSRVPNSFTLKREYLDASDSTWKEDKPTESIAHQVDELTVSPERQQELRETIGTLSGPTGGDIHDRAAQRLLYLFKQFDRAFRVEGDVAVKKAGELKTIKHMPALSWLYPAEVQYRPYEELDILYLAGDLVLPLAPPMPGGEFNEAQRQLILETNITRNGGRLKSDDPGDPHQDLSRDGVKNHPEIDHIIPRSRGGTNWFSNARVVSWDLNNRMDRVKDPVVFQEPSTISLPQNMQVEEAAYLLVVKHGPQTPAELANRMKAVINFRSPHTIKDGRKTLRLRDLTERYVDSVLRDLWWQQKKLYFTGGKYAPNKPGSFRR